MIRLLKPGDRYPSDLPSPAMPEVVRDFFAIYILAVLVLIGAFWLTQLIQKTIHLTLLKTRETAYLQSSAQIIRHTFQDIVSNLQGEAASPVLQGWLLLPTPERWALLAIEMQRFAISKKAYSRLKLFDRLGNKAIRVDYHDGKADITDLDLLRSKSDYRYFREAWRLAPGTIYISPIESRVEPDEPPTSPTPPIIRLAMPIADQQGTKRAVLSFDYRVELLLAEFRDMMQASHGQAILVNGDGDWLSEPDGLHQADNTQESARSFRKLHPRVWKAIEESDAGVFQQNNTLFVFRHLRPLSNLGLSIDVDLPGSAQYMRDYSLVLVTRIDLVIADTLADGNSRAHPVLFVALALLPIPLSWLLARVWATRRLWRRAIQESELWLRAVFKGAGIGIALVRLNGRIKRTNEAFQNMLSYTSSELEGRNITSFMQTDSQSGFVSRVAELEYGLRDQFRTQINFRNRAAHLLVTQCNVTLITDPASERGIALIMVDDVTDRMRTEEQAQTLQEQLAHLGRVSVMGELAVILAHELSTPLNSIVNFAAGSAMRIRRGQVTPEDLLQPLERISQQAKVAGSIIQRVRGFVGKGRAATGICSIDDVVKESVALVGRSLERKDVELTLDIAPGLPSTNVPNSQLQQVLINLMLNAAEAMAEVPPPAERRLRIRASKDEDTTLKIQVSDSGPGIDDEGLEKIFQPFFTTKQTGLGMGLSICHTLVESWGGRIQATRGDLGGLSFEFTLP